MIYGVTRVMVMVLFVLTRGIISHLLQSGGISGPGEEELFTQGVWTTDGIY